MSIIMVMEHTNQIINKELHLEPSLVIHLKRFLLYSSTAPPHKHIVTVTLGMAAMGTMCLEFPRFIELQTQHSLYFLGICPHFRDYPSGLFLFVSIFQGSPFTISIHIQMKTPLYPRRLIRKSVP